MDAIAVVSVVIAALAALASAVATVAALKAVRATRDAAEASVIVSFFDRYFDPSMAEALRTLSAWRHDRGDDFARKLVEERGLRNAEAVAVDDARRLVKGYFHKAARLHFAGVIRDETLRELVYVAGLNVYLEVVDPMELALSLTRRARTFELLKTKFGHYTESDQIESIPPKRA